jgi:hypothetical protein
MVINERVKEELCVSDRSSTKFQHRKWGEPQEFSAVAVFEMKKSKSYLLRRKGRDGKGVEIFKVDWVPNDVASLAILFEYFSVQYL